jgi:hypothetical protein
MTKEEGPEVRMKKREWEDHSREFRRREKKMDRSIRKRRRE